MLFRSAKNRIAIIIPMKTPSCSAPACRALVALLLSVVAGLGQGSVTPPGAPGPTMKTLDQVEPRTPINSLPFIITQSGSYYLTKSFAQNFTVLDAITIRADNVTVDFCGFTIQQTNATPSIVGVRIGSTSANTPLRNAVIKNGTIAGFAAVGITCLGGRNCLIENLQVTGCAGGITFQAAGTAGAAGNTFRRCRLTDNTSGSGGRGGARDGAGHAGESPVGAFRRSPACSSRYDRARG